MTAQTQVREVTRPPAETSRPVVLAASEVVKHYTRRAARPALRGISFSVRQGEMVGLLGPNGAGKTTLLKILSTLLEADGGTVTVLGKDVRRDPVAVRRRLGLITCDERSFYWRLSGRRNLSFFATLYGVPAARAAERIAELLEALGLTEAADRPYHSYSTGMRQKMAVARGLLGDPRLVLYDEPTRSLDPLSAQNLRAWIAANRARSPETTHLLATNQLHEAERLCDRVIILNRGEIIADDSIAAIRARFEAGQQTVHRIHCAGGGPLLNAEPERGIFEISEQPCDDGTVLVRARTTSRGEGLSHILDSILRSGGSVLRCETEQAQLDDIFCALVRQEPTA